MSDLIVEAPDYSKVKIEYTQDLINRGIPPPEKWKGLELARSVGSKGYTFDTLLEDLRKMIGFEVWEGPIGTTLSDAWVWDDLRNFVLEHGDDNPLYTDPDYGENTRYGAMLMYPTSLHRVRYGMSHGVQEWGPYPISSLVSGLNWEFYNVIRVNTRFRTSMKLREVLEKKGRTGRLAILLTDDTFWNQRDECLASGGGVYIDVGKSGEEAKIAEEASKKGEGMSKTMLYERPTYHYSEEEVAKIVSAYENEERRGDSPRYWEDVNVGDKIGPVVKGPLTFGDFENGGRNVGGLQFRPVFQTRPTRNPLTGWSEPTVQHHFDFNLCRQRGLPGPFDLGVQRMTMSSHLISNWMGDDGFLRRVSMQVRKPNYYGDTQWFTGEIVNKYKDKVGEIEYGAVDISFSATNQVGEITLPGKATIYLPSHELGEVVLPVPLPPKDKWPVITQRDVKDFINEIETGETLFPSLQTFLISQKAAGLEEE